MILNEEEKLKLLEEIDLNAIELIQKRQIVADMSNALSNKKSRYKSPKRDIKMLDEKALFLKQSLKEKEDELDILREQIIIRD